MAKVDMAADMQTGKDDLKGLHLVDSANVVDWSKKLIAMLCPHVGEDMKNNHLL